MPGEAAVPVLGWSRVGVSSPSPVSPAGRGSSASPGRAGSGCRAVPEPPPHPSLPVLTQWDTSWPGHPASPWPLPTACPVRQHLLSSHCHHPAAATRVTPAWALPAPHSGHVGVGCLGPSGPRAISALRARAEPDPGTPESGGHRLAGTGRGQQSPQKVAPEGASWSSVVSGMAQRVRAHRGWHRALWHSRVPVSGMAQHTAAGTGPLSPPGSALARAESMTRRGI